jgi:hypothetical protein
MFGMRAMYWNRDHGHHADSQGQDAHEGERPGPSQGPRGMAQVTPRPIDHRREEFHERPKGSAGSIDSPPISPSLAEERGPAARSCQWRSFGQTLARGEGRDSAALAVAGWLASTQGHCETLMEPGWESIGIAYVRDGPVHLWTANFGDR